MKKMFTAMMLVMLMLVSLSAVAFADNDTYVNDTDENETDDDPVACCMAMTASCLACSAGMAVDDYCEDNPDTVGCEDYLDDDEVEVDEEDQEEIDDLGTPYGAQMRLTQLAKSIERNIVRGEEVLEDIGDELPTDDKAALEGILDKLQVLLEDVEAMEPTGTPEEMALEYVAVKKEAISLSADFRRIVHKHVAEERAARIRENVKERIALQQEEMRMRIQEKKQQHNYEVTSKLFERLGIENDELLEQIKNGSVDWQDVRDQVQAATEDMSEEAKQQAAAKLREEKAKRAVQARQMQERLEEELKAKAQERREEVREAAMQKREELRENRQERINDWQENARAIRQEYREDIRDMSEQRRDELRRRLAELDTSSGDDSDAQNETEGEDS